MTVWKKVGPVGGGDDVQLGDDVTNRKGRYAVAAPRIPGRYYSRAEGDTISTAGNCLSARSAVTLRGVATGSFWSTVTSCASIYRTSTR